MLRGDIFEVDEIIVDEPGGIAERSKPRRGDFQRFGVGFDAEHLPSGGAALPNGGRMPAPAQRAIDVAAAGLNRQRLQRFIEHDRNVRRC